MDQLIRTQAGVVARWQLMAIAMDDHDIRRLVRRRELTAIHPGVYVDHTGPPTWLQRAWGGVLHAWPAALCGASALRAAGAAGPQGRHDDVIHVAIDHARRARAPKGIEVHRRTGFGDLVLWNLGPPRVKLEDAVIDVALSAADDLAAVGVLAAACGTRRTTAARLLTAVGARGRVARRRWVEAVLRDIAEGTCSVLEHGYLEKVERPHGLPRARRQVRAIASGGAVYRDVQIDGLAIIELDGRLFHGSASAWDRDMERDLDATLDGTTTVRLGWGQVYDRPCSTAGKVGRLLTSLGWDGTVTRCGPSCTSTGNIPATR